MGAEEKVTQYGLVFEEHEEEQSLENPDSFPVVEFIDSISTNQDSGLWHLLIEGENYIALQYLQVGYKHKVDCIYIDPPYNTGDTAWKYNNNYNRKKDKYKHSYWLSMMKNRLLLAKELLNPDDSVLIVAIDEKEYLRLGLLLEQIFPKARIQMISTVIRAGGVYRKHLFYRNNEYLFFIMLGKAEPQRLMLDDEWFPKRERVSKKIDWRYLKTSSQVGSDRESHLNFFYPIYISKDGSKILGAGEVLPKELTHNQINLFDDKITLWPIRYDGSEGRWRVSRDTFIELLKKHYIKIGNFKGDKTPLYQLPEHLRSEVENGSLSVLGYNKDGSVILDEENYNMPSIPKTQWDISKHEAGRYGSSFLNSIFHTNSFSYAKSYYAVYDCLRFFLINKPEAVVLDFFAGSGTTLHAVNLLNQQDKGRRKCIMVTNDENNIARDVMWPRTVCTIKGTDIDGNPLKGNYFDTIPMSDGFKSNAVFYSLKMNKV